MRYLLDSWAPNTRKQYNSSLKLWSKFCSHLKINPDEVNETNLVNFLANLADEGKSFSTISSIKSAICIFWENLPDSQFTGPSAVTNRVIKGIFRFKPPTPKYSTVWDVSQVVNGLEIMGPNRKLDLDALTRKTVGLLSICSPQRVSEISALQLSHMRAKREEVSFVIPMTKNRRMGEAHTVSYKSFRNPVLCPVRAIKDYIARTQSIRGHIDHLFVTTRKPHKKVAPATVARWVKDLLRICGVDATFGAHSTRAASTSKAASSGVPLSAILDAANWSPSACVFQKFYNKPIETNGVQNAILKYALPYFNFVGLN